MQELARIDVHIRGIFNGPVNVVQWTKDDPFPTFGPCVGVDTETELITETNSAPPLVVLGVFDPSKAICYISYWEDAAIFINQLSKHEVIQFYFNVGFDEQVLDNEDNEKALMDAIEFGRVRDMQIRTQLYDIATVGFIPWNHWKLEQIADIFCHIELDKGEKDDPNSHRLTFKRGTPITTKQAVYLCWDCMATWAISTQVPEQPTEVQHTKGMCVLAHISHNGFPVDTRIFEAFEQRLQAQKDEYRLRLLDYGFPDPYKKQKDENGEYKQFVENQVLLFMQQTGETAEEPLNLCKGNIRMALLYAYNFSDDKTCIDEFTGSIVYWLTRPKPKNLRKAEAAMFDQMMNEFELLKFFAAGKEIVMNALLGHFLENIMQQEDFMHYGYNFAEAIEHAGEIIDANPHWLSNEKQVGPVTYLQNHIKNLLKEHPKLQLEKTEKSGNYRLSLKDMWRLEDADVKDAFLNVYTQYKHSEKYLSTYLNREYLQADNRIHARFTNLLKTTRTSCTKPNLQNLPSRDKQYPLKNMFTAPEGAILCATDFSFIELCGFAQSCYSRFGSSVMRDVINAGLDPHRWFAAVMNGIIKPNLTEATNPEWVKKMNAFLKEKVSDGMRQHAKAANFGFTANLIYD
jgi:hypothetical protein